MACEKRATAAAVHDAIVASAGLPTWLVYHDGGYTPDETSADRVQRKTRWDATTAANEAPNPQDRPREGPMEPAKAGWGYLARYYDVAPGMVDANPWPHEASPMIFHDNSSGPVQLDDMEADYNGCVELSNNKGELSAIPQILVRMLRWRRWRQNETDMTKRGYAHLPVDAPPCRR